MDSTIKPQGWPAYGVHTLYSAFGPRESRAISGFHAQLRRARRGVASVPPTHLQDPSPPNRAETIWEGNPPLRYADDGFAVPLITCVAPPDAQLC